VAGLPSLLLDVFPHTSELGEHESHLYSLFAFVLLHDDFTLEAEQARRALTVGSSKGRTQVAWYWWQQTNSATDYGATLFRERLKYLLTAVWPLDLELKEEGSSENLVRLASCCGTEFPNAVATIIPRLTKMKKPEMIIWSLKEKDLAHKYPVAMLALLDSFIADEIESWAWKDLNALLTKISAAEPSLNGDPSFMRLHALVQRFE